MNARCLTAAEAATYCGLTVSGFRSRVARGLLPGPLPQSTRWDRNAIDAALDQQSGLAQTEVARTAYDRWKERRANRA